MFPPHLVRGRESETRPGSDWSRWPHSLDYFISFSADYHSKQYMSMSYEQFGYSRYDELRACLQKARERGYTAREMLRDAGIERPSQSDITQLTRFIRGDVIHPRCISLFEQLWNAFHRVNDSSLERHILDFYAVSPDALRGLAKNICGTFFQYKLASDGSGEAIKSLIQIKETDARLISVDEHQRDMDGRLAEDYEGVVIFKGDVYIFFMREIKKKDPKTIYFPVIQDYRERVEIAKGYSMEVCRAYSQGKMFRSNVWMERVTQERPLDDLERECKRVDDSNLERKISQWLSRSAD